MKKPRIKSYLDEILEQKISEALEPQADSLEQMEVYGYLQGMKQAFYLVGDKKAEQRTNDAITAIKDAAKEIVTQKIAQDIAEQIAEELFS